MPVRSTAAVILVAALGGVASAEPSPAAGVDSALFRPSFDGSGVLSLEAVSRGARLAVAVDRDRHSVAALAATARDFGADGIEVHVADARAWLAAERRRFDVIFLDPPFAEDPWSWLLPACGACLAANGVIYVEAGHAIEAPPGFTMHRHARAGKVHYHLLHPHKDASS